ncbi:glycosyl hydrolase family 18 protein [Burkholderia gladioli]|uniref:glycosyl hydrolase family 18 protein n=1 Tax=Burkholderia gladioli TaxID=28095 RepID=UPI001640A201|nr:glycosyl hydrolase family 18 protein [Burkholderia gladioli]MBU9323021.1 chitinase [Burkholderia gladioli]
MKNTQPGRSGIHSKLSPVNRNARLAIAMASALCFANAAFAAPGAPALKAWEITSKPHGFVQIELDKAGAVPYKELVRINKAVDVPLPFDIYYNGTAVKALAVVDGVADEASAISMTGTGGTQKGSVVAHVTRPGKKQMQVRVFDDKGAFTDSAPLEVMVFDTTPDLADDLPNNADKANRAFRNTSGSVVGSYFATWSIYGRKFSVDQVPVENLTHMLYGFVPICGGAGINDSLAAMGGTSYNALQLSCRGLPDFSVAIHDGWGEIGATLPGQSASSKLKGVLGQMMAAKKRNPELKILPSIGGWTLSDPFHHLHDASKRRVFVDSVEQFLRTWKFFDGVDIDWEFPGGKGANASLGDPLKDGPLYVTLMKELRQMLDRLSRDTGKTYQLTSAIGSGDDKIAVVDYREASKYMDYIFDMSYDFYGAWSMSDLGHQTALNAPAWRPDTAYTTANSVKALLAQGVKPGKIVVGAAMYGRGWTGVSGYQGDNPFTGTARGPVKGDWENGILDYKSIAAKMVGPGGHGINGYEYHYDQTAEAPYVFNKANGDLVSFDDTRSVAAKGEYVRKLGLGGLFSWEIDADNGDILNAMHSGLGHEAREGSAPNRAPLARTGGDLTVDQARRVTLDASKSSDPEGGKLRFAWKQASGPALSIANAGSAKASVEIPAVKTDTRFVFEVTVTDAGGLDAKARTSVLAKASASGGNGEPQEPSQPGKNHPPVAHLSGPDTVQAGESIKLSAARSSDADGDKLGYRWLMPAGFPAAKNQSTLTVEAPELASDTRLSFTVEVSDGKLSSRATHTVLVKARQQKPGGGNGGSSGNGNGGNAGQYPAYQPGTPYKAGDIVSNGGKLYRCKPHPATGWCAGAAWAYAPGSGSAWQQAWDLHGDAEPGKPAQPGENHAPVAKLSGPDSTRAGQAVTLSAAGSSDADGDPLSFKWNVPAGIRASQDGATLRFDAPELPRDTKFDFSVSASDGKLSSSARHTVLVKAKQAGGGEGGQCAAAWQGGKPYTGGSRVQHQGRLYEARWWTSNEPGSPDTTGPDFSGKVWKDLGECGK